MFVSADSDVVIVVAMQRLSRAPRALRPGQVRMRCPRPAVGTRASLIVGQNVESPDGRKESFTAPIVHGTGGSPLPSRSRTTRIPARGVQTGRGIRSGFRLQWSRDRSVDTRWKLSNYAHLPLNGGAAAHRLGSSPEHPSRYHRIRPPTGSHTAPPPGIGCPSWRLTPGCHLQPPGSTRSYAEQPTERTAAEYFPIARSSSRVFGRGRVGRQCGGWLRLGRWGCGGTG